MEDQIRLLIPATPEFVRLARLTAASLASRLGFTFDEVEDLRIAVDELCHCVMGSRGLDAVISLTCSIDEEGLTIEGTLGALDGGEVVATGPGMTELSRRILDAVVDDYDCRGGPPQAGFSLLKKSKRGLPGP